MGGHLRRRLVGVAAAERYGALPVLRGTHQARSKGLSLLRPHCVGNCYKARGDHTNFSIDRNVSEAQYG